MDEENVLEMDCSFTPKLGPCEVCGSKLSIYTCPKCEVQTCSLPCVKIHKRELECDGIRDRTKFVHLKKFTNMDMQSDYRLLEEITRSVDAVKRDKIRKFTAYQQEKLPRRQYKLRAASISRETILKFLPSNFSRHKENTSMLDWQTQIIYWKIDWVFANAENLKCVDPKCAETAKIGELLGKYFNLDCPNAERLQYYHSTGLNGVRVLLKAEETRGQHFYELDLSTTLQQALRFKVIIECPAIFVILKEHSYAYDIIKTDDYQADIEERIRKLNFGALTQLTNVQREREKRKKSKNLLFENEYSDDGSSSNDEGASVSDVKIPKQMMRT